MEQSAVLKYSKQYNNWINVYITVPCFGDMRAMTGELQPICIVVGFQYAFLCVFQSEEEGHNILVRMYVKLVYTYMYCKCT